MIRSRGDELSAGANFHFFAASVERRAKYRLEPRASMFSPTTLPERSTVTRTATLIWPRIDATAPCETAGISSCNTADLGASGAGIGATVFADCGGADWS